MKVISLNTYFGVVFEPLMAFINKHKNDTDIFCFQEIMSAPKEDIERPNDERRLNFYQELLRTLPEYTVQFTAMQNDFDLEPDYPGQTQLGITSFIRKQYPLHAIDEFFLVNDFNTYQKDKYETIGYPALATTVEVQKKPITIINLHGVSFPAHKRDAPARFEQTRKLLAFCESIKHEIIICGDFNSYPDIESITAFEKAGFRNLIKDFDIKTTRGSMNKKLHPEFAHGKYGWQEYADYTFVSSGITVQSFEVPDEPISDHLPMILEFIL